ncbi:dTDP-4-dehydrorhamnose reductase [Methanobacterium paludis]|uniref:dTDP-4-dehydrorhamnose reductase n=1 Tax=Methanobacterium paludis (strain DSM 25820 / JCM 18151 / SWAN1) TaxID=868131 RepID=F6D555_METPW|nr:dTDP-4-dehydrorhamnose reductase [Methanobacterium paludis]AEG17590.1 dTDP-4-dehydrorhamnose reductase [Methanobacterium paludis]
MKRLFITGGSGLLGSKFKYIAGSKYEIVTTHHKNPGENSVLFDITDENDVMNKITSLNPDAVIHAAALTNVDYCEDHPKEAWNVNAKGTDNIAKACEKTGSKLTYVSTDFVFDGERGMYSEEDKTNPLGYYASTKLEGEEFIRQYDDLNYAIARVSVLYGWHTRMNFVTWVIDELKNGNEINIVTDQYNSPTLADNAAEAMIKIFEKDKTGIYHTVGDERINRFDFARNIAEVFDLDSSLINPTKSTNFVQKAKRPKDSSLNVEKVQRDLGIKMLNTTEGLNYMKKVMQ